MKKLTLTLLVVAALAVPATLMTFLSRAQVNDTIPPRPEGPCDIYAAGGAPCAAAHSTTRALYKDYDGPLYQVIRQSDGKTLDIGVVPSRRGEAGGYADAAAQDAFCADTYCFISIIYDQSPQKNHLIQAPRGYVIGPAMGGMDNVPLADLAPVTLNGHKVYGVFIIPGMGMRWNDPTGTAVDDQAEGQYWVINGHHYSDGCCFDYGNAETDSTDDGDGTMETTYFGIKSKWYHGDYPGPWLMTDQENNLVGCVNEDPDDKYCETLKSINWRFVTQMVDGAPHRWRSMGGNAQEGALEMLYDGGRIKNERSSYDPMRKQGAILLGNGGDNGNVSSGTFYEGAMTFAGTFPSEETNQAVQANIVAAKYDVAMLEVASAQTIDAPAGLQTWAPGTTQNVTVKFTNTLGDPVEGLTLTVDPPRGWKFNVVGKPDKVQSFRTIVPGESVYATFAVTSSDEEFNGDINAKANWNISGKSWSETAHSKVRNVQPVRINEFRIADNRGNTTNNFIELYNASDRAVDISGWTVTEHSKNIPFSSSINIPSGTRLQPKSFYLIGLSNSGLAVDAAKGDDKVYVRTLEGMSEGDQITIGFGRNAERRLIKAIVNTLENPARTQVTPSNPTFVFQPLPNGPDDRQFELFPAGSSSIPVISVANVKEGQKLAIGYGAKYPHYGQAQEHYEVVTVTYVGKPGTHAYTSFESRKGDNVLRVSSVNNISPGDKILLDIDSEGHGKELVTVKSVGTASSRRPYNGPMIIEQAGTGITLTAPLKYNHSANVPFSVLGTGISFIPPTKFDHYSNEPVFALVYALELDEPLGADHPADDVVCDAAVTTAGYQDAVPADLLFGGPALQPNGGTIVLRDSRGMVVDALNYGRVLDSQYAEGYHAESGFDAMGSLVMTPYVVNIDGYHNPVNNVQLPNLSAGRFPDGNDTDNNKYDFRVQPYFHLAEDLDAGAQIIRVSSTDGLKAGQKIFIGGADNYEQALVTTVGIVFGEYDGNAVGLSAPLQYAHGSGEAVSVNIPTPGEPNRY